MMPTEINGPHGVAVSPDRGSYHVSIGHGTPYGTFWKYRAIDDEVLGRVTLGLLPATIQLTHDGALAFVANFNLHGDMAPSSVSVVSTDEMVEIARITTCTMPHGSRINLAVSPDGTYLLGTNERGKSVSVLDVTTGAEVARIPTHTGGASRPTRATPS